MVNRSHSLSPSQVPTFKLKHPWWFYAWAGGFLLTIAVLIFVLLTLRFVFRFDYLEATSWFGGLHWGGLTIAVLLWGAVNLHWGHRAMLALKPTLAFAHLALVISCGLATLGIHTISISRSFSEGAEIRDTAGLLPLKSELESFDGAVYGTINRGKAWFSLTCVTCHGATGEGINNLAPSLKDSEFLATASPVDINLLIRRGRAIDDPANKSGKPMPARGADDTITNDKIADLVAFVMSLKNRTADPSELSWEGVEIPPPELSHESFRIRPQNPVVRYVNRSVLLMHSILMIVTILPAALGLLGWLRKRPTRSLRTWLELAYWGWATSLICWLLTFVVL